MDIGNKLKRLRIRNGLTQEELADRCELSKGFISQVERDLASPSIATLEDMLQSLGTDLKTFFNDAEDKEVVFTAKDTFVKQNTDLELTISLEEFGMLQEVILQKMNDSENSLPWPELIQKYFPGEPRYTLEELRKTEEAQTREDYDWYGYMIEERDLCL